MNNPNMTNLYSEERRRQRTAGRILMILGAAFAIIAAAVTFVFLRNLPAAAEEGASAVPIVETQRVVVAFQTIEPWEEIPADALGVREYPLPLPADAVTEEQSVQNGDGTSGLLPGVAFVQGKISNTRIYPGQVIVASQLVDKQLEEQRLGLGSNAAYIVPDGKVAIAIPLDQVSSVAGAIRAGDQVDIIANFTVPDPDNPEEPGVEVTQFMMQRVQILRLGLWSASADGTADQAPQGIVTVIVDPQQALELKRIRDKASFEFVLRSITDDSEFETAPVSDAYLVDKYNLAP